jgi:small neutral amino acid transporter SnatA (MarC family)
MPEFAHHWFYDFMTLLVVLDPIATVPLFMAVTVGLDRKPAAKVALYAVCRGRRFESSHPDH